MRRQLVAFKCTYFVYSHTIICNTLFSSLTITLCPWEQQKTKLCFGNTSYYSSWFMFNVSWNCPLLRNDIFDERILILYLIWLFGRFIERLQDYLIISNANRRSVKEKKKSSEIYYICRTVTEIVYWGWVSLRGYGYLILPLSFIIEWFSTETDPVFNCIFEE